MANIVGTTGDDILVGTAADDILIGDTGNDIYLFGRGFGNDIVYETGGDSFDSIEFSPDVLSTDIQVTRDANSLYLTIFDTGEVLTLYGWYSHPIYQVEQIVFGNGEIWDPTALEGAIIVPPATSGDDELYGGPSDDVIDGLEGNDVLTGAGGNDTLIGGADDDILIGDIGDDIYVFGRGYGFDDIYDLAGNDIVQFMADVLPADIQVTHGNTYDDGFDLYLTIADTGEWLRLRNWYGDWSGFSPDYQIEQIQFADGTIWTAADLELMAGTPVGTDGDNVLIGTSGNDILTGLGGYDELVGSNGNDILDGGTDNDYLAAGIGDDIYVFGRGYGRDLIFDEAGNDTIQFPQGILSGDIVVASDSYAVYLIVSGTGDQIELQGWFEDPAYEVEQAIFDDGSVWQITPTGLELVSAGGPTPGPDNLTGTSGADTLTGGAGNDTLTGGAGNDTYVFNLGDGVDTIDDLSLSGEGNALELGTGIDPAVMTLSFDGGVLLLNLGGGDQLRLTNFDPNDVYGAHAVETFAFADGTVLTYAELIDRGFDLVGTAGDDVIYGTNGVDRIVGGDGNDTIISGGGNDTIDGGLGNDTITGGSGDNVIQGGEGDDIINGGAGNDTLYGGTGNDTYRFDAGNGSDVIYDSASEFNTLVFGPGVNPGSITLNLGSLFLNIGNDEGIHLENFDPNDVFGTSIIQNFVFDDGTTLGLASLLALGFDIDGTDADDALNGTSVTDRITGGIGNDTLAGGVGDDTYYYSQGDGLDALTDVSGTDTVSFGTDITFANTIIRTEGGTAQLRFLDANGNETSEGMDIALNGDGTSPIEAFAFADGSSHSLADLTVTTQTWYGDKKANTIITGRNDDTVYAGKGGDSVYTSTGNDTLYGDKGNDKLYGEGGNDRLYGGKGKDFLDGGAGDDILDGGEGHNTLIGGQGNDTLILGKGEDTVRFGLGDGWDTLKATAKDPEDSKIRFGEGITKENLWLSRSGNDLQVNVLGTDDGITIENWFNNKHKPIEEFKTANGDELEARQVGLLIQAMAGFTPVPGSGGVLPTVMPDELQATLAAAWES